ncbi:MAG TPA: polysaccharide biosynthesis C-terminal domain-containing protein [Blastocatellia bacterium]|nr:polysaccharide biosynthesis C-terminal domain-containing protein [Blastocatellia bacterium]
MAILPLGLLILIPAPILGVMSDAFAGAATAVRILSCGLLVAQAAGPLVALLLMSGRSRQVLGIIVGGASLYTLASLYAIPTYGIDGAAAAATGTVLLVVPVLSVHVQRTLGVRIYAWALWKPVAAAGIAYSAALLLSVACGTVGLGSVVLVGSVATMVYVGALVAFGAEHDDRAVLSMMRKAAQRLCRRPEIRRRAHGDAGLP